MSIIVSRTCTEVPPGNGRAIASDPKPLREYRSVPAYVLLGDPGSGKTTEFRRECSELGDTALFVPASDFIELHLDSHPEWRDRTLFIDGLDEMRAGAAGTRDPLGEIRNRLDQLACPNFRISCREADWLGPTDRRSLTVVSPDSEITVLVLDRLNDHAIRELLVGQVGSAKAEGFERGARDRGLGAMLANPQALKLLIDAVGQGDRWPKTRLQTFELACLKMASEHNEERLEAVSSHRTEAALDTAGRLCALLLLCGFEGYTLARGGDTGRDGSTGLVPLDDIGRAADDMSRQVLKDALSTNLFVPEGERGFVPCHRQVAEFLAGRWLSKLVKAGLPAPRIVALMRGPTDGRVVTALRGLSAWLAAQPGEARRQLIEADPVGVGLYGDIATFAPDDKERLLRSLTALATQGQLFGHEWHDSRANEYRYSTGWAFRSLASTDLVEPLKRLLEAPVDEAEHGRAAEFILDVLANAETSETESLAVLAPDLLPMLYDDDRPPRVTIRALNAYMHIAPSGNQTDETLVALLDNVQQGSIPDQHDDLRRALLEQLYPNVIRPADVWRYAVPRSQQRAASSLGSFWDQDALRKSSDQQISELLDALCKDAQHLVPALAHSYLDDLPIQLLARGLRAFGDTVEAERLFCWLDVTGRTHRARRQRDEDARFVKRWLEDRPEVQKALFLVWLRERVTSEPDGLHRYLSCDPLLYTRPPGDLGLWCLDQATVLEDSESALAQELLGQAYWALADTAIREGLTLAVLRERVGTGLLARRLAELEDRRSTDAEIEAEADEWRREVEERSEQLAEEERQRQQGWREGLGSHLDNLRDNRFFAPDLHTLAQAYMGLFVDVDEAASSRQRIHDFIGGEEVLVEAVMTAIREAVFRDDVPTVDETISLHSESKHSWLAYPVLASMHLLDEENPARLDGISADRKRRALAIHYCVPSDDGPPPWHDRWFQHEPTLVLEVLQRCAVRAVRAGAEFVPCLDALDSLGGHDDSVPVLAFNKSTALFETRSPTPRSGGHDDLVHDTRLRVLAAIPTRASNQQMGLLDSLLARAMQHPDTVALRELAARKLSLHSMGVAQRVRWLTVNALLSADPSLQPIKRYVRVKNREVRVRHFAEFLRRTSRRDDMRRSSRSSTPHSGQSSGEAAISHSAWRCPNCWAP